MDCRTEEERDPKSEKYIAKSRYSGSNHYISSHEYVKEAHNDALKLKVDPEHMKVLANEGIDERLAYHIASLFARDPVPAYEKELEFSELDDDDLTCHFENLQSTNWNSMRFKPPPSKDS